MATKKLNYMAAKNYLDYPLDLRLLTAGVEQMNPNERQNQIIKGDGVLKQLIESNNKFIN